ncbi:hypothetical protein RhiJN_01246 [Ceratobasidium sp. AG-Ba]|nr:hypothetical protein RhiJN_01246 [Ceratobasidium sp. AG-Ba]QRW02279.1 hypothetical protein RhiLY_01276 [Ceratobasidium sp. AG-Ba]
MDNTWDVIPLAAKLPSSLEELEFLRVHVPECEVIDLVKQLCPNIRTLRLVFCTQFNNPDCTWWSWHQAPGDHGYYMKGHELPRVKEYAKTVGRALRQLPYLTNLHVGVYFIPHEAVQTHRTSAEHIRYHPIQDSARWLDRFNVQSPVQFQAIWAVRYPSAPAPNIDLPCLADRRLWETPCPLCQRQCADRIERAERLAASIFTAKNPNLRRVSFASFVAEKRISPSEWEVCRSEEIHPPSRSAVERVLNAGPPLGAQVQVWTKHVGASDRSAKGLVFRLTETGWEDAGHA